jgi:hypothetical protein
MLCVFMDGKYKLPDLPPNLVESLQNHPIFDGSSSRLAFWQALYTIL